MRWKTEAYEGTDQPLGGSSWTSGPWFSYAALGRYGSRDVLSFYVVHKDPVKEKLTLSVQIRLY